MALAELTAAAGSWSHGGRDERRDALLHSTVASALRLEVDAGPHPFDETQSRQIFPLKKILTAQVRSNGREGPQGWTVFQLPSTPGRYFVARPAMATVCVLPSGVGRILASPCPCVRLAADGLGTAPGSAACLRPIHLPGR